MPITIEQLQQKISALPKEHYEAVDNFVNSLQKKSAKENDWATELTENQFSSIKNGLLDYENGKVLTDAEARAKIKAHIKQKVG